MILTLLGLIVSVSSAHANQPPNIVFVIADDLRFDALACTGNPHVRTPHIDRIAAEGMNFQATYVTTPICSPSRASFLSGLYASTHRILNIDTNGIGILGDRLVTFPQFLRTAGYETAFIGKWHMGFDDTRRPGFDTWISFKGQGQYRDPVVNENGTRRQLSQYMTDYLNQQAVDFINNKDRADEKPFMLYLSHKAVHIPYLPAERYENEYPEFDYLPPASADDDLADQPAAFARVNRQPLPYTNTAKAKFEAIENQDRLPEPQEPRWGRGTDTASNIRDQMRCLQSVDDGIGMLIDALSDRNVLDQTVFVFTSDNGFLQGEHGVFNQKRVAFEESIRIPLLIRYPPLIAAGTQSDQYVLNVDIAPTFLELAGIEVPPIIQGKSLVPLFQEPNSTPWRRSFFAEYFMEKSSRSFPSWQMMREGKWKYIHYPNHSGADELYDMEADPSEMHNVFNDANSASIVQKLKGQIDKRASELSRARSNDY
tara:strand:- start:72627 stop:74078 length:1452 start_codon:yes stop_codon:yes gene_type:complete